MQLPRSWSTAAPAMSSRTRTEVREYTAATAAPPHRMSATMNEANRCSTVQAFDMRSRRRTVSWGRRKSASCIIGPVRPSLRGGVAGGHDRSTRKDAAHAFSVARAEVGVLDGSDVLLDRGRDRIDGGVGELLPDRVLAEVV